jgi:D-beta-D-heptose 7-phosphate kinase/D-beta-D-heptose 1-phosphate adenosyltransferase
LRIPEPIDSKIYLPDALLKKVSQWKSENNKIVFTNGCFDILHPGHIFSFVQAAKEGDRLIVGLNADLSVKKIKGKNRPVNNEKSRAVVLSALSMVDAICIFNEETPLELIKSILPEVLVKGGDYTIEQIAGAKEVIAAGGKVVLNPIIEGYSTSSVINKMSAD